MECIINKEVNYFNEALMLALKAFNDKNENNELLDYSKISLTKEEFYEKYKNIIEYFEKTRLECISISDDYKDLENIFKETTENITIPNILIYSNLKNSIKDYTKDEFLLHIKKSLISSITYRTGEVLEINNIDNMDLVDKVIIFNDSQKYILLKMLNNTSNILDYFYEYINKLEDMLKESFNMIKDTYYKLLESIKDIDVLMLKDVEELKKQSIFSEIKKCKVYLFLNLDTQVNLSIFDDEDNLRVIAFLGFLQLLVKDYILNLNEKKDYMKKKLSVISDQTRLDILLLLSNKKLFGKEIAEKLEVSKSGISYHLNLLVEYGLLQMEIDGKKIYYSLNINGFNEIISFLESIIKNSKLNK